MEKAFVSFVVKKLKFRKNETVKIPFETRV